MADIAWFYHWPVSELWEMEIEELVQWHEQIDRINEQLKNQDHLGRINEQPKDQDRY